MKYIIQENFNNKEFLTSDARSLKTTLCAFFSKSSEEEFINIYEIIQLMNQPRIFQDLCLDQYFDINIQHSKTKDSLLHLALILDKPEIAKILLHHPKIDVSLKNNLGLTTLMCVTAFCSKDCIDLIQMILSKIESCSEKQSFLKATAKETEFTALMYACARQNLPAVEALLINKAPTDSFTPVSRLGHSVFPEVFHDEAFLTPRELKTFNVKMDDCIKCNPFFIAVETRNLELLNMLLQYKANIFELLSDEESLLMRICKYGLVDFIEPVVHEIYNPTAEHSDYREAQESERELKILHINYESRSGKTALSNLLMWLNQENLYEESNPDATSQLESIYKGLTLLIESKSSMANYRSYIMQQAYGLFDQDQGRLLSFFFEINQKTYSLEQRDNYFSAIKEILRLTVSEPAPRKKQKDLLDFILDRLVLPEEKTYFAQAAFVWASRFDNIVLMSECLKRGVHIDALHQTWINLPKNEDEGHTALTIACRYHKHSSLTYLINQSADVCAPSPEKPSRLFYECLTNADFNDPAYVRSVCRFLETLMHPDGYYNKHASVKRCFDLECFNMQDEEGTTFMMACIKQLTEDEAFDALNILLACRLNEALIDNNHDTALNIAIKLQRFKLLELLVKYNEDCDLNSIKKDELTGKSYPSPLAIIYAGLKTGLSEYKKTNEDRVVLKVLDHAVASAVFSELNAAQFKKLLEILDKRIKVHNLKSSEQWRWLIGRIEKLNPETAPTIYFGGSEINVILGLLSEQSQFLEKIYNHDDFTKKKARLLSALLVKDANNGNQLLHQAVSVGSFNSINMFLQNTWYLNINELNDNGISPIMMIYNTQGIENPLIDSMQDEKKQEAIVKLFLDQEVHPVNLESSTRAPGILELAVRARHFRVAKILLEAGSNPSVIDYKNDPNYQWLQEIEWREIRELIDKYTQSFFKKRDKHHKLKPSSLVKEILPAESIPPLELQSVDSHALDTIDKDQQESEWLSKETGALLMHLGKHPNIDLLEHLKARTNILEYRKHINKALKLIDRQDSDIATTIKHELRLLLSGLSPSELSSQIQIEFIKELMLSLDQGAIEEAIILLEKTEINIEILDESQNTVLLLAAQHKSCSPGLLKQFIAMRVNLNAKNDEQKTAADFRFLAGDFDSLLLLLENGAYFGERPFNQASRLISMVIQKEDIALLSVLLERAKELLSVNLIEFLNKSSKKYSSPIKQVLNLTNKHAMTQSLRLLSKCGVRIDLDNETIQKVLVHAIGGKNIQRAVDLIDTFIDINPAIQESPCLIEMAINSRNQELIESLIHKGVDFNTPNWQDLAPILIAYNAGNIELCHLLLRMGVNVNVYFENRDSLLERAIQDGHTTLIQSILSLEKSKYDKELLLELAAKSKDKKILQVLKENPHIKDLKDKNSDKSTNKVLTNSKLSLQALEDADQQQRDVGTEDAVSASVMHDSLSVIVSRGINLSNTESTEEEQIQKNPTHLIKKDKAEEIEPNASESQQYDFFEHTAETSEIQKIIKSGKIDVLSTYLTDLKEKGLPVKLILDHGAPNANPAIIELVYSAPTDVFAIQALSLFMKLGANVNINKPGTTNTILNLSIALNLEYLSRRLIDMDQVDHDHKTNEGWTYLMTAIACSDFYLIDELIRRNKGINEKNNQGKTALIIAAERNNSQDVIASLINAGARFDIIQPNGEDAIIVSIRQGFLKNLHALIKMGANWRESRSSSGQDAMQLTQELINESVKLGLHSPYKNTLRLKEIFLFLEAQRNSEELMIEIKTKSQEEILKHFKNLACNPNAVNKEGDSLLILAVKKGYQDLTEYLLCVGADPDVTDINGDTPLIIASRYERNSIIQILLAGKANPLLQDKKGLNFLMHLGKASFLTYQKTIELMETLSLPVAFILNQKDKYGETILHRVLNSLTSSNVQKVYAIRDLLLSKGSCANVSTVDGITPLYISLFNKKDFGTARLLVKSYNASIDYRLHSGESLLHKAIVSGDLDVIRFLLDTGLHINDKDLCKKPLLVHAHNHLKDRPELLFIVINLLIEFNAPINDQDEQGFSALMLAALDGNLSLVKKLKDLGAAIHQENNKGQTALQIAKCVRNHEVVRVLQSRAQSFVLVEKSKEPIVFFHPKLQHADSKDFSETKMISP